MKVTALIASLLLGSSSVALADDAFAARAGGDVSRRDHRGERWRSPTWAPITDAITASHRNVIRLRGRHDDLRAIRLQTGSGATYVYAITLRFDDGTRENIEVGKWLYAGDPLLTFDLPQDRGGVERIVINTWTSVDSTYQVHGQLAGRYEPGPRPPRSR